MPRRKKPRLKRGTTHYGKPKSDVTLPPSYYDAGAEGPANRDRLHEEDATEIDPVTGRKQPNPNRQRRVRRQSWVEVYARQGKLTKAQHSAAENLYAAFCGHPARDPLAAIGETIDHHGYTDPQSAILDARRRFHALWCKVPVASRPVMEHVVLEDMPMRSMAGCYNQLTQDRYMDRLRAGLDAIA